MIASRSRSLQRNGWYSPTAPPFTDAGSGFAWLLSTCYNPLYAGVGQLPMRGQPPMPKVATHALIWSPEKNHYELHTPDLPDHYPLLTEDEQWFRWLSARSSFSFQGQYGHLTLRKEPRPRGGEGYWYAYRTQNRRTVKKYVGRTAELSITRLEATAQALTTQTRSAPASPRRVGNAAVSHLDTALLETEQRIPPQRAGAEKLLMVKLQQPRLSRTLVEREHLLARLDEGLSGKLTLLSAPAGCGKTTLVRQWVADRSARSRLPPVAWVWLDAGDNDPHRFWRYLITACQTFQANLGRTALALLATSPPPLEAALTLFLNDLSQLPLSDTSPDSLSGGGDASAPLSGQRRAILVLEDYHVITSPEVHQTVTSLIDHLPTTLHVMLLMRGDPPFPLAHLRASDDLNELHAQDLRFSPQETQTFLQHALPFPLSEEVIASLQARMEGWVAGLRLLTLALQGRSDRQQVEHMLASISGTHRHLVEYFVSEVLVSQPEPLQRFLLHTSMLSRLTGPLCDAVTGGHESEQLLELLAHADLFLQPLDEVGEWYRYHALFAEAMQHEARRRLGEEAVLACSRRASSWYEQQSLLTEAIETALQAGMLAHAAVLIERLIGSQHLHEMQEHHTYRRWLGALPEALLGQHPRLCLRFAMLLLFSPARRAQTSWAAIERPLHLAEHAFQAENNRSGLAEVGAFRALFARVQGDLAQAAQLARQALAWLPEQEHQWRGTCLGFIGEEELQAGSLDVARQTVLEALALFATAGNTYATRASLLGLGEVCLLQGELRQAADLYREVFTTAGEDLFDKGQALLGLARLSYEWNALEVAQQQANEAFELGARLAEQTLQAQASLVLARIEQARGQTTQAQQRLHALLAHLLPHSSPLLQREILAWQAHFALAAHDLAAVQLWSTTRARQGESMPRLQQEQEELLLARLLLAQGKPEEALLQLEYWQVDAHQQGRTRSEMEVLLLLALAHAAQQRLSQASLLLKEVLLLAQAEGYQRLLLDAGEPLAALLRAVLPAIRKDLSAPYVRTLLQAFAQPHLDQLAPLASEGPASAALLKPLSAQEQRVLRLVVAGCSNSEIAEALVVSSSTVKTHVRNIYHKLNVKSRKEAREIVRSWHPL
jgi:LuxR family transcriptional regulator, maltose regulon positive regulatory protein